MTSTATQGQETQGIATTAPQKWQRRLVALLVAFGIIASVSVMMPDVAEAAAVEDGATNSKMVYECFNGGMRVNTTLQHKFSDSASQNWRANYRLFIYKWNASKGYYQYYNKTGWLTGWRNGLNYWSGYTFRHYLNLPAGNFTVGVQSAIKNPRTGGWVWDRYVTFGYGATRPQRSCNVRY